MLVAFIALPYLAVASYCDLFKNREVPDWLNYSLVAVGLALSGLFSVVKQDASFILSSLLGFAIFFGLQCVFC